MVFWMEDKVYDAFMDLPVGSVLSCRVRVVSGDLESVIYGFSEGDEGGLAHERVRSELYGDESGYTSWADFTVKGGRFILSSEGPLCTYVSIESSNENLDGKLVEWFGKWGNL